MILPIVGHKSSTIKPDDLVRTPRGRTCLCLWINADGSRELQDVLTGETFSMMPSLLYCISAAVPKPWRDRQPC